MSDHINPKDLLYTKEHEWVRIEGDRAIIGITDFAQYALGDVVYVELPDVGTVIVHSTQVGIIESVKAASEFYTPVSGEIIAHNDEMIKNAPELINDDPYGGGWIMEVRTSDWEAERVGLLSAEAYEKIIEES